MAKVRAQSLLVCGLLLAGGLFAGSISAEQLQLGGTEKRDGTLAYAESGRPTRGMTQARVESRYGDLTSGV